MEFKAKTVEEATEMGLKELGITIEQAQVVVKEQPTKTGLFGLKKTEAVVEVTKKLTDGERAQEFLQKVLDILEINAKVNLSQKEEKQILTLITDKSSSVIGYRGEVLDALQTIAGAIANIGSDKYKKVVVDCEDYRGRREDTLVSLAHKLESKATEMRREVQLEPMPPFERRIIHMTLAESKTVTTKSDGKEPNRFVVIVPNDKDEFSTPYNAGRNKENGKKDGRRNGRRDNGKGKTRRDGGSRPAKSSAPKKTTISFGTYLGNSLKDN